VSICVVEHSFLFFVVCVFFVVAVLSEVLQ
jgi:hypothetical protein